MKIKVNSSICEGFGTCAVHAPETFLLDEWGYAQAAGEGVVAEEDEDRVRQAIVACPVHAIVEIE